MDPGGPRPGGLRRLEVTRTEAFQQRFPGGLDDSVSRGYLLVALRNRSLRERRRGSRLRLLAGLDLDALPASGYRVPRLHEIDADALAGRILGRLSQEGVGELAGRLGGGGPGAANAGSREGPSWRTRKRRWSEVRRTLESVAGDFELGRDEMEDLLLALAAKVTA